MARQKRWDELKPEHQQAMLSGFGFVFVVTVLSVGSAICGRPDGWALFSAVGAYGMIKLIRFMLWVGNV